MQFTVGLKLENHNHIAVDAEDALIAALRVKSERPEERGDYLHPCPQNRRGNSRHPSHGLSEEKH